MAEKKKSTITVWKARHKIAKSNQDPMFDKFKDWFELLYAVVNEKDYDPWRSKVFFPRLSGKLWNFIPKLVLEGGTGFSVKARDKRSRIESTKDHEELLDYQYNNPEFDEPMFKKLTDVMIDACVTGKGFALIPWTSERKEVKERVTEEIMDPETGEVVDEVLVLDQERVIEFVNSYNDFIPLDRFSVFYSPAGKTLQKKHWIMIEDWKTPDELKTMVTP
jgi:hypothetical protein